MYLVLTLVLLSLTSLVNSADFGTCAQEFAQKVTPRTEQGRFSFLESSKFAYSKNGAKIHVEKVNFTTPFTAPPTVIVTLESLTSLKANDIGYWLHTGEVTNNGVEILFEVWGDTPVSGGWVHWYAFRV